MDPRGGAVAVEIVECEGNVLGHAFEQADGLLGQRMGLIEIEQQYADRIAVALDRNGRGRPRADLPRMGVPAPGPLVVEIVVTDKGAAGAERRRRQSLAVVGSLVDRTGVVVAQQRVEAAARACHRAQAAVGAGQQHAGAEQFAAEHGGIANPLKQFVFGAGAQNCLVGGAERREHPRHVALQYHRCPNRQFRRTAACTQALKRPLSIRVNEG